MAQRKYLQQVDSKIDDVELNDYPKAVFILHDQLNLQPCPDWVREQKPLLIFVEAEGKGHSLPYHKKKLVYVLSSMRHFAIECQEKGYPIFYHSTQSHFDDGLQELLGKDDTLSINYMKPSEWETRKLMRELKNKYPDRLTELDNNFFLAEPAQWTNKIEPGYRAEYFYRDMRNPIRGS